MRSVWFGLRRRSGLFASVVLITMCLVILGVLTAPREFTAEASIMIEPKTELFAYGQKGPPDARSDPLLVDTEVELIRSRAMAIRVWERAQSAEPGADTGAWRLAKPANDFFDKRLADVAADFASLQANSSKRGQSKSAAPAPAPEIGSAPAAEARPARLSPASYEIDHMLKKLEIERVGTTFLIKIRFSDASPVIAAQTANAYSEEYILQQLEAQYLALRQTNGWIDTRLKVLRDELRLAEEAAAKFRAEQGIVEPAADGSSFTEKSIAGIAADLAAARSNLATLNARYATIRGLLNARAPIDSVSEVMASPVVGELRRQQSEIARRRAELGVRYGERHPELRKIAEESAGLDTQISSEVSRIVQSLAGEVRFASAQVASLEQNLGAAQGDLAANNSAGVELLDLQRDIEASRAVYEALLNRQKELNERDRLAEANARIITAAETPDKPSRPRKKLLLAGGTAIAFLLAGAIAFVAEVLDSRIRNTGDVRRTFGQGAPVVLIPRVKARFLFRQKSHEEIARRFVRDDPNSLFAQSLRDLRMQLKTAERDVERPVSVAFTSVLRGDGATTAAFSFCCLLAQSGARVAFIDCAAAPYRFKQSSGPALRYDSDAAQRDRAQALPVADADRSAVEAVSDETQPHQSVALHAVDELRAQPLRSPPQFAFAQRDTVCGVSTFEIEDNADIMDDLDADAMLASFSHGGRDYDYIIIDAPPMLVKPEAGMIAASASFAVLVMEWCATTRNAASAAAQRLIDARARLLTFAVSKVDEKQRFYFEPDDRQFYFRSARS